MCSTSLWASLALPVCFVSALAHAQKPTITLDEYLNTTSISSTSLSPDASAAVIATEAPDWKASVYRRDLWLWTDRSGLAPLTHSGTDERPQWSPDGKWIAFVSDRSPAGSADADADGDNSKCSRIWLISASGGEALPLYSEKLDVHTFAWSPDSSAIYLSAKAPLTHDQEDKQKDDWKDVVRWREQYRGDVLLTISVTPALTRAITLPAANQAPSASSLDAEPSSKLAADSKTIATSDLAISEIAPSPDGRQVAFLTEPIHKRIENPADYDIFLVDSNGGSPRQITHNQAVESNIRWSPDGKWLHLAVAAGAGSLEGKYRDVQGRLYRLDPASGKIERLGSSFDGSLDQYTLLPDGRELALGLKGTETQVYLIDGDKATKLRGIPGSYAEMEASHTSSALLVRLSTINDPQQVYLMSDPLQPDKLKKLTSFNPVFADRAQPDWQPYTWKSDDGVTVEGVLIFPPAKKGAKHLRMFTFIHGGPADADGNRFGADWYDWATYAADNGWLVFRPNYRGSTGYGDEFMLQIEPHLVSKPGRDILAGVDALVRDGYADPDHLAIGGYSYGGYMTNWLITQTTRFKSAVTGAGAVEHAANWGNDDETWDDAWYLGGRPWENPQLYQDEAALFRFDKVKTPTHLVQGGADVRVSYLEGETMERALQSLGIPHSFLVFPGEGHSLDKNPWHGYIKLREELKWLEKYDKP
ncbi:MAG TPA: S9 family peptidase [Terracidiphilus sp.]|jgi:dipeptidyl aminopeptidase/acylaminoacyl peptidase